MQIAPLTLALTVSALGALLLGCDTSQPCTTCPGIEGAYLVSWKEVSGADGCAGVGPRPTNFNVSRVQSSMSLLLEGQELKGTLRDTWDFSLRGGTNDVDYLLRGRVSQPSADGGYRLQGTLSTTTLGGMTCAVEDGFVADRL